MAEKEKYGSIKRFGTRYGRINKIQLAKLETLQRQKHKCPFCSYLQLRRVTIGIWQCGKCREKFAGSAYHPFLKVSTSKSELKQEA